MVFRAFVSFWQNWLSIKMLHFYFLNHRHKLTYLSSRFHLHAVLQRLQLTVCFKQSSKWARLRLPASVPLVHAQSSLLSPLREHLCDFFFYQNFNYSLFQWLIFFHLNFSSDFFFRGEKAKNRVVRPYQLLPWVNKQKSHTQLTAAKMAAPGARRVRGGFGQSPGGKDGRQER